MSTLENPTAPAGIIISGQEQPLTVGQPATLRCVTVFQVSFIEWRNSSSAIQSATSRNVLNYTINLISDDLHGVQYTCRVVAIDGTEYTQRVEIDVTGEFH